MSEPSSVRTRKLVFINRYYLPDESATSQMLTDLACRLAQQGMDVRVICSRQLYDNPAATLPPRECLGGTHIYRVWTFRFGRHTLFGRALDYGSFYLSSAFRLLNLLRRGDIVIAKTDPPMLSIFAALVAKLRGAHLVNWLQDVFPEVAAELYESRLPRRVVAGLCSLRDASLRAATRNVVLGLRMQDHLSKRGIPAADIRVIENWANGRAIVPTLTSASRLRAGQGWLDKFVVAYSGNLGRAHEYDTIIAAAELLRERTQVLIVMIGGGFKMQLMRVEVERRGLANVRFLPSQSRESLSDSLAAADVHLTSLLPKLEGLIVPSKFYGVLAAGRPVLFIGDPLGELANAIHRIRCGAVVDVGDDLSLVRHIVNLQENEALRTELGRRAREAFETYYTLDAAVNKWQRLLSEVGDQTLSTASP